MTGYLRQLVDRTLGIVPALQPRPRSVFETVRGAGPEVEGWIDRPGTDAGHSRLAGPPPAATARTGAATPEPSPARSTVEPMLPGPAPPPAGPAPLTPVAGRRAVAPLPARRTLLPPGVASPPRAAGPPPGPARDDDQARPAEPTRPTEPASVPVHITAARQPAAPGRPAGRRTPLPSRPTGSTAEPAVGYETAHQLGAPPAVEVLAGAPPPAGLARSAASATVAADPVPLRAGRATRTPAATPVPASPPAPPQVTVNIGRVEVRPPPAPEPVPEPAPGVRPLSLDEYLDRRGRA
jgi:hypothetical protein